MATTETILVLAEELRQQHFPQMELYCFAALLQAPRLCSGLVQFDSRLFERQRVGAPTVFISRGAKAPHSQVRHHESRTVKWTGNVVKPTLRRTSFATVISATKRPSRSPTYLRIERRDLFDLFSIASGRLDPWLQPYTDKTIEAFAKRGTKKMAVVTPSLCLRLL